jgi:hypothetical protein
MSMSGTHTITIAVLPSMSLSKQENGRAVTGCEVVQLTRTPSPPAVAQVTRSAPSPGSRSNTIDAGQSSCPARCRNGCMGIAKQSLYDTFGDKRALYLKAMAFYRNLRRCSFLRSGLCFRADRYSDICAGAGIHASSDTCE